MVCGSRCAAPSSRPEPRSRPSSTAGSGYIGASPTIVAGNLPASGASIGRSDRLSRRRQPCRWRDPSPRWPLPSFAVWSVSPEIAGLLTSTIVAVVVFGLMLIEAARAARNERAQRARGGVEPDGDVYSVMRVVYPAAFLAMFVEGWLRGGAPLAAVVAGAIVFTLAKLVKWWAIVSLGPHWTFRVIVV